MAIRLVIVLCLFAHCASNKKSEALPLATYMQQIQMEYAAIGNAIKVGKADAIAFHINKIETISASIIEHQNNNPKLAMPFANQEAVFLKNPLNQLLSAAENRDEVQLKEQFNLLTNNCKSCHNSNKVTPAFIPLSF